MSAGFLSRRLGGLTADVAGGAKTSLTPSFEEPRRRGGGRECEGKWARRPEIHGCLDKEPAPRIRQRCLPQPGAVTRETPRLLVVDREKLGRPPRWRRPSEPGGIVAGQAEAHGKHPAVQPEDVSGHDFMRRRSEQACPAARGGAAGAIATRNLPSAPRIAGWTPDQICATVHQRPVPAVHGCDRLLRPSRITVAAAFGSPGAPCRHHPRPRSPSMRHRVENCRTEKEGRRARAVCSSRRTVGVQVRRATGSTLEVELYGTTLSVAGQAIGWHAATRLTGGPRCCGWVRSARCCRPPFPARTG